MPNPTHVTESEDCMKDQTRNLNPHKPARAAMYLWGERYSKQRSGSMDFWDILTESERRLCRDLVADIEKARPEILRKRAVQNA